MTISKQQKIDEFIKELTEFVDKRYQINKETDLCNHSYVIKNLLPEYEITKRRLEDSIEELIDNN